MDNHFDALMEILSDGSFDENKARALTALYGDSKASLLNDLMAAWQKGIPLDRIKEAKKALDSGSASQEYEALKNTYGHPLSMFSKEAQELDTLCRQALSDDQKKQENKSKIWEMSTHDMKKGDLLYPVLKVSCGMSAPADLLWDTDIANRTKYSGLMRDKDQGDVWKKNMDRVLEKIIDMTWVEENLLYPLAAAELTPAQWEELYQDSKDYNDCLNVEFETWPEGEAFKKPDLPDPDEAVVLGGGVLTVRELNAMLNALPLELTFVDADDTNQYFNEGHKAFKRPTLSLHHHVFDCHPVKVGAMVRGMIEDFRSGKKDKVQIWMMKQNEPYFVTYMALREKDGTYLGTLEVIQPMQFAKDHFEQAEKFANGMKGKW